MSLNFKNRKESKETTGFSSQYFGYGIHLTKISAFELKESSTKKFQVKFILEGPDMGDDFNGAELPDTTKARGLVCRTNLGIYFDPSNATRVDDLMNNLMFIAEKAGVSDKVKAIEANTLEDLLGKFCKAVKDKYMWFVIKGEEYEKDGKTGMSHSFKEGKIGQDGDRKIYQVFCKEAAFCVDTPDARKDKLILEENGVITKVMGVNTIGASMGKKDTLAFVPKYDLKLLEAADKEKEDTKQDNEDEVDDINKIFKTGEEAPY